MSRFLPRSLMAPAVVVLFLWMIVPLVMTIYFSLVHYNLMQPGEKTFVGLENFRSSSPTRISGPRCCRRSSCSAG